MFLHFVFVCFWVCILCLLHRISERSQVIEVPKISRQDVEVVKTTPQERISERMGKQSRSIEVPKISCQKSVEAVKSVPQERIPGRRCEQREVIKTETSSQAQAWRRAVEQSLGHTRHELEQIFAAC